MLVKKPMSGAEIVEVIQKETGGRWIPSSGSVYPLLRG
jgi:DNA-binding PadR family transcriptional regulator